MRALDSSTTDRHLGVRLPRSLRTPRAPSDAPPKPRAFDFRRGTPAIRPRPQLLHAEANAGSFERRRFDHITEVRHA